MIRIRAYNHDTQSMIYSDETNEEVFENKMCMFWQGMLMGVELVKAKLEYMLAVGGSSGQDKNGKHVYAGDIIKAYRRDDAAKNNPCFAEVILHNGCFMVFSCTWHEFYRLWQSEYEIVGEKYSWTKEKEKEQYG